MKKNLISLLMVCTCWAFSQAQIVINEMMQSNIDCLYAEHNYPDSWVEILSTSTSAIPLGDIALSDVNDFSTATKLTPATRVIIPGEKLVVYCDKETGDLHMPFRLESGKGELYLFYKGEVVDKVSYKKMPAANISFGRISDNAGTWGHQITPTPGSSNQGGTSSTLLPAPEFSIAGALLNSPTTLTITYPSDAEWAGEATLCVTLDGSEPTMENAVLKGIENIEVNIDKSMVVKAKFISDKYLTPRATVHSYIFHPREITLPVISLSSDDKYFYDENEGIFPAANKEWRRPLQFEYFPLGSTNAALNQLTETRVSGGYTRSYAQKSQIIYANKRFGTKRLNYAFWDAKPEISDNKSIVLRNSGNDWFVAHIRDAFMQQLFGHHVSNLDYQEYQPAIYYINGVYKGIIDIRERANDDFIYSNFGGLEDVHVMENSVISAGNFNFGDFVQLMRDETLTYEKFCETVDVDEFMNYYLLEAFSGNNDFPSNNQMWWRPIADGGKWRWIAKDIDRTLGLTVESDFEWFKYIMEHSGALSLVFRKSVTYPEFRNELINRCVAYLGDFYKPAVTQPFLKSLFAEIEPEFKDFTDVWDIPYTYKYWDVQQQKMFDGLKVRPKFIATDLGKVFELGAPIPLKVIYDNSESEIAINGITLTEGNFDGWYYANRPLSVTTEQTGCDWQVAYEFSGKPAKKEFVTGSAVNITIPEDCKGVNITFYPTAVESVVINGADVSDGAAYDLMGRRVSPDAKGVIIKNGKKIINR